MRISKIVIVLLVSLNISSGISAQKSSNIQPKWMTSGLPIPQNNTYIFVSETATGKSLELAREACLHQLASDRLLLSSARVTKESDNQTNINQKIRNGELTETISKDYNISVNISGREIDLIAKQLDEYWTQQNNNGNTLYQMTVLYQSAVVPSPNFDFVLITSKYNQTADYLRAIVPGWEQLYKGSTAKGITIMGGTTVLAIGTILSENMRKSYYEKIYQTHSADSKKEYANLSNNYKMIRNVCIGGMAALYIYNVVDAIVAPGANHVVQFAPMVSPQGMVGATVVKEF